MEYEIKQLFFDDNGLSLQKVVELENLVYEGKHKYDCEYFKRWYLDNPMGRVVSFNAFYGDKLVAHYACIPYKMKISGKIELGLLDIFTVTHPEHRGKGLFKLLAKTTYNYAKQNGFKFVMGIANANSFPGYQKYFPEFKFVSQLEVKMGFGNNISHDGDKLFSVHWDEETLNWRTQCINANYLRDGDVMWGNFKPFVQTFMGFFQNNLLSKINIRQKGCKFSMKIYVGLGAKFKSLYFTVPKFIKHSPFNMLFMDLTDGELPEITKDNILFQLIDLDVA